MMMVRTLLITIVPTAPFKSPCPPCHRGESDFFRLALPPANASVNLAPGEPPVVPRPATEFGTPSTVTASRKSAQEFAQKKRGRRTKLTSRKANHRPLGQDITSTDQMLEKSRHSAAPKFQLTISI
jgi:hypothetical protein